jgi:diguanylate cyclase (GGDEF)-like protein
MALKKISNNAFDDDALSIVNDDFDAMALRLKGLLKKQANMNNVQDLQQSLQESNRLLDEMMKVYDRVSEESIRDPLTGLFNRRFFDREKFHQFDLAQKEGADLTVLMVDIDHFGKVNKQYGHEVGDTVLKMVAQGIRNAIRYSDLLFRYGGDEFILILPNTNFDEAQEVARRILFNVPRVTRNALKGQRSLDMLNDAIGPADISLSMGLFHHKLPDSNLTSPEDFIRFADFAANRAKTSGRNQVCIAILHPDNFVSFSCDIPGPPLRNGLSPVSKMNN